MVVYTSNKCNVRSRESMRIEEICTDTWLNCIDFMNGYDYMFYVG